MFELLGKGLFMAILFAALYQELGERGNEMENSDYEKKKADDLQKRLSDARSSIYHLEIVRISCMTCPISFMVFFFSF